MQRCSTVRNTTIYHFYFELRDAKIVAAREYNDTAHVRATLRADE